MKGRRKGSEKERELKGKGIKWKGNEKGIE